MKTVAKIILAAVLIMLPASVMAEEPVPPLTEVNIKYEQLNWQTYEFFALSNVPQNAGLSFEWTIDKKETFTAERLRFFFPRGEHFINVKAADRYGNTQYDEVKLTIGFWSLKNNKLWWAIYLLAILLILYYWVVKIVYLFNRRKVSRQARYFLDLLDEHGWVERVVAEHVKMAASPKSKGKSQKSSA
ncbi:hypothetical protein A2482_05405 [Candidatus Falkowbacteria bacterium RIFOXYC2_FULL_48_21]|uniref:PKD domain-containing protein n=1 Tax=Candidatus Falkowbacteria bacterium RIFOXYC2_FULL_48_21 TaxID=1798005 RepID=A0A1F5TH51_9BACT|nr:MAG: hypothetical protein A2482_05405 [Candidatus Falkowbacteria bacterium RIFOXYC2_FULL_48_21]